MISGDKYSSVPDGDTQSFTTNAMSTNDLPVLSPGTTNMIGEGLAFVIPIIMAALVALWRRAAGKSRLQNTLIEAVVRGIQSGSEQLPDSDTNTVKRAVRSEAMGAGVNTQLDKVIQQVKSDDAAKAQNGEVKSK